VLRACSLAAPLREAVLGKHDRSSSQPWVQADFRDFGYSASKWGYGSGREPESESTIWMWEVHPGADVKSQ